MFECGGGWGKRLEVITQNLLNLQIILISCTKFTTWSVYTIYMCVETMVTYFAFFKGGYDLFLV